VAVMQRPSDLIPGLNPPGKRRPPRTTFALGGFVAGVLLATVGVLLVFGLGWALIAVGVVAAASFLLLFDVDREG
jgi:hypothetical protein